MTPPPPARTLTEVLAQLWADTRAVHPTLPPVSIVVSTERPSADHSHDRWGDGSALQIVVSRETLEQGAEAVLTAVIHDAAHLRNWAAGVVDTTRHGHYHNARFRTSAEALGLSWPEGQLAPPSVGFRDVSFAQPARDCMPPLLLGTLQAAITDVLPELAPRRGSKQTSPRVTAECQCQPARKIQITPRALEQGPIICGICQGAFTSSRMA